MNIKTTISMYLKQAKKYKAMNLPVQRKNATEFALFYRKMR